MRLIDADELKEVFEGYYDPRLTGKPCFEFDMVIHDIDKAPTVEAVPVVHGEWIFGKKHDEFVEAECSACNSLLLVKWYDKLSEYNYCPRCGADMRK